MSNILAQQKTRRFGDYELLGRLGHGGMSAVYKARDLRKGSIVALKVASRAVINDPQLSRRFELEFSVVHPLRHANLVRVHECGKYNQIPYLVMEFVDGPSLCQYLKKEKKISEFETLAVLLPITDALGYLHERNIIHRDVKPANILAPTSGVPKLADLGLVKDLEASSRLTRSNFGLGTMQFAAPEQFENAQGADPRSDIYALAATMYVALTGECPFGVGAMMGILEKKMANEFEAPISKVPHLRPSVDAAIRLALHADPAQRPASVREFAALVTGEKAIPPTCTLPGLMAKFMPRPKENSSAGSERRVWPRYAIEMPATCRALTNSQRWSTTITDISTTGLCMLVKRRFENESLLDVSFALKSDGAAISQLARVRWVRPVDAKSWMVGCEFGSPMSTEDLETIFADQMEKTKHFRK